MGRFSRGRGLREPSCARLCEHNTDDALAMAMMAA